MGFAFNLYDKYRIVLFWFRSKSNLLQSHKDAWKYIWNSGKIDIEGNLELSQAVYGSMYYILSSIRSDWPYGLSPGGLSGGEEYMGHTFWDQDIWMYPFLVLLYPDLARSCLQYRYERLPAARLLAEKYGFNGKFYNNTSTNDRMTCDRMTCDRMICVFQVLCFHGRAL